MVESCFTATSEHPIVDCLAIGQLIDNGSDERVILFVKLPEGHVLSPTLEGKIKAEIRARRSPRHVPAKVRGAGVHVLPLTMFSRSCKYPTYLIP